VFSWSYYFNLGSNYSDGWNHACGDSKLCVSCNLSLCWDLIYLTIVRDYIE